MKHTQKMARKQRLFTFKVYYVGGTTEVVRAANVRDAKTRRTHRDRLVRYVENLNR